MTGDAAHLNAHVDLRDRARLAARDTSGYLATARALRRREAVAELPGALEQNRAPSAPADLWLRLSIAVSLAGCALAGLGVVAGIVG